MSTDLRRSVALAYRDPTAGLRAIERAWCERSLSEFVEAAWHVLEPGRPYVKGWATAAILDHLEAVTVGEIRRLVITVPPGMMKSMSTSVFWGAWLWGPLHLPEKRIISVSHAQNLAIRDSLRMRRLITSEWYQGHWPHVTLTSDQAAKIKYENTAMGFREAATARGITGSRGDIVICDDLLSVDDASSDAIRDGVEEWFREALPTRLNDPDDSAIVLIMQRLHERDPAAVALELGYEHLNIPMRFEKARKCITSIGWEDPRTEDGELAWPERFPEHVVAELERSLGDYGTASQLQQSPEVRGGNVFKRDWWRKWEQTGLPKFDYVLASLDTAYEDGEQNDFSALVVLGAYTDENFLRRTLVLFAWEKRLDMHELAKEVDTACEYWNVDLLLIENAAAGKPVQQELRRMFVRNSYAVRLDNVPPIGKVPRAHSIVPFVEDGTVFLRCDPVNEDGEKVTAAEALEWRFKPHAQKLIDRCAKFPRDDHDDMVDAFVAGMRYLRKTGAVVRREEHAADEEDLLRLTRPMKPLYPGVA